MPVSCSACGSSATDGRLRQRPRRKGAALPAERRLCDGESNGLRFRPKPAWRTSASAAGAQSGTEGGIATDQVAPTQFLAIASPLFDQLEAVAVDGQGIGLVFDLDLTADRLVELGSHGRKLQLEIAQAG